MKNCFPVGTDRLDRKPRMSSGLWNTAAPFLWCEDMPQKPLDIRRAAVKANARQHTFTFPQKKQTGLNTSRIGVAFTLQKNQVNFTFGPLCPFFNLFLSDMIIINVF